MQHSILKCQEKHSYIVFYICHDFTHKWFFFKRYVFILMRSLNIYTGGAHIAVQPRAEGASGGGQSPERT